MSHSFTPDPSSFTHTPPRPLSPPARLSPFPAPSPGSSAPEPCGVPPFGPLRVRGSGDRLRRALVRRRRAVAACLAVSAATLAVTGAGGASADTDPRAVAPATAVAGAPPPARKRTETVSAPVRIADAATVRLLRRGDRVDVIASPATEREGDARVVAAGVRVASIPQEDTTTPGGGALVVLSVPRPVAAVLAGAGATSQLAVSLW
ncbi:hypothetical protein [Streptomyces sp. NPDC088725]|uniref:hypothetical protein n=1 Tax=Streptomyces sp. NPDC088725 TaxID=3365873 RepID=UPI0038205C45